MHSKVKVKKSALDYFRRKAREAFPLEIQALCVGTVVSPQLTVIDKIVYPKQYALQTRNNVQWYLEEVEAVKHKAEALGKRVVGDLHSHPEWVPVMSDTDYHGHIGDGYRVCGICSVHDGRTQVVFWTADSALPLEIVLL